MLLEISVDASGGFEVALVKESVATYVSGYDFAMADGAIYQDLVFHLAAC
jgi:hypothetical protein